MYKRQLFTRVPVNDTVIVPPIPKYLLAAPLATYARMHPGSTPKRSSSLPVTTSPPKRGLHIRLRKFHHHLLLPLYRRINLPNHPLRPVDRTLIRARRLLAHEIDEVPRERLLVRVAKVLLNALAQRLDAAPDLLAVVLRQQVARGFARVRRARGDGGWVGRVRGHEGVGGVEEVLLS